MKKLVGRMLGKSSEDKTEPLDLSEPAPELELVPEDEPSLLLRDVYEDPETAHRMTIEINSDGIMIEGNDESQTISLNNPEEFKEIEHNIRCHIAKKISMLAPILAREDKQYLLDYTITVLKTLARDQEDRVRRILAEELKSTAYAPHDIVYELAWDTSPQVATPMLEYSPLLSDEALIEILSSTDLPWVSEAIARRTEVSEEVSDTIIATDNDQAIFELLQNDGASLSETGLDTIIEKAPEYEHWHHPLAYRPELTQNTMNRIASFISLAIFNQLEKEGRLSQNTLTGLRQSVNQRLRNLKLDRERTAETTTRDLFYHGRLDAERVGEAIEKNDEAFVAYAFSVLTRFSVEKVRKILTSNSPKAIVSLAWKAGINARDAIPLQLKIGKIKHTKVLHAREGTEFPMSENEMAEYLDFFS